MPGALPVGAFKLGLKILMEKVKNYTNLLWI